MRISDWSSDVCSSDLLTYTFESDSFTGNDLSVLARHMFDGYEIMAWAYAQSPDSIVWAVRSDGTLLGCTYLREHQVLAWHRHVTDENGRESCRERVCHPCISRWSPSPENKKKY